MLAVLNALKSAVREFALREESLEGDYHAQRAAEGRAHEAATAAHRSGMDEAEAAAAAGLEAERERLRARFEQRKRWINQAHFSSRKRALDRIRQQEGRIKYKVQEGSLRAERTRDEALAAANQEHTEFQARLAGSREDLAPLESAARSAFRGYGGFQKLLSRDAEIAGPDLLPDENDLLGEAGRLAAEARKGLDDLGRRVALRVFRFFPGWVQIAALLLGAALLGAPAGIPGIRQLPRRELVIGVFAAVAVLAGIRRIAQHRARPAAVAVAGDLVRARRLHDLSFEKAEARFRQGQERILREFESTTRGLDEDWKRAAREALDLLDVRPRQIDEQAPNVVKKCEQLHQASVARTERDHAGRLARLQREAEVRTRELAAAHAAKQVMLDAKYQTGWAELETEWKERIHPIYQVLREEAAAAEALFPEWDMRQWEQWTPPREFANAAKFGRLEVDTARFFETVPRDKRLSLPGPAVFSVPLLLAYPREGSVLFETASAGADAALAAINNIIFRLLSTTPPGKLSFTIFDPVGLGQSFAGIMHLADYEESNINSRIWTQTGQLEEKLAELSEHMEKVIQMYLRNEYETIADYNAKAGTIAEKYHFLVVANFPVNFSDSAARRLHQHRDQRRAVRGVHADSLGSPARPASGHCSRGAAQGQHSGHPDRDRVRHGGQFARRDAIDAGPGAVAGVRDAFPARGGPEQQGLEPCRGALFADCAGGVRGVVGGHG